MYNFKRVGMKIIYRITDTLIHRKKIRNIQLGFEFDRNWPKNYIPKWMKNKQYWMTMKYTAHIL